MCLFYPHFIFPRRAVVLSVLDSPLSSQFSAGGRMSDLGQVHKVLDSGYSNVPLPQDTEK